MSLYDLHAGRVVLLGEGDFSFSVAYVHRVEDKVSVTATSLLSQQQLNQLHKQAADNVTFLLHRGIEVLYEVDATRLDDILPLNNRKFDRIIFNFPHIGGKSNIKKNRDLLLSFFESAVTKLAPGGDICVSLAQGQGGTPADRPIRAWHDSWQVVGAASYNGLVLRNLWTFDIKDYPRYTSTGFRSLDRSFYTGGALTYVFRRNVPPPHPGLDVQWRPAVVDVGGRQFHVDSRYIASRINRHLLDRAGHPLNLLKRSLDRVLTTSYQCIEQQQPELILDATELKPRAFQLTRQNSPTVESPEQTQNWGKTFLLTSLLDSALEDPESDSLHVSSGPVFRKLAAMNCRNLATKHEIMLRISVRTQNNSEFRDTVKNALESLLGSRHRVTLGKDCEELEPCVMDYFGDSELWTVNVEGKSENMSVCDACNQVADLGKPTVPNPKERENKLIKISRSCGFIGVRNGLNVAILDADCLCQVKYDIPDARILWSEDPAFLDQFKDCDPDTTKLFEPLSMYPPLWRHDVAFWENPEREFQVVELMDVIREACGDWVKCVLLRNVWTDPETGLVSRCYRTVYQSYEAALSHSHAHRLQDSLRSVIHTLGVELR